ncbi:hypothetical protein BHM03_00058976 [Ensete ventricosum]|nr:hypothetical protein BHM03_00058976 [Ensete ventricosum]
MWTARYRAVQSKSTVNGRLREKEGGEEKEGEEEDEKYLTRAALPRFPHAIRCSRAKNRLHDPLLADEELHARSVARGRRIAHTICRSRAIPSPRMGRRNEAMSPSFLKAE